MKRFQLISLCLLLVTVYPMNLHAQAPRMISYQGFLTDKNDVPVADGAYQITISLYDQLSGGTMLWTEIQTVPVKHGVFSAGLGSVTPFPSSLMFGVSYFLGIAVSGGAELSPRTPLLSAPFAMWATVADTARHFSGSGVVTTVNSQSGAITLQGGGGTTINNNGSTITISSSGSGGTGIQGIQNSSGALTITNPNGPIAAIDLSSAGTPGTYTKVTTDAKGRVISGGQISASDLQVWSLMGNAGTTFGTNFIGTTDSVSLQFRVNNVQSGLIEVRSNGNTGMGFGVLRSNTTGIKNTASGFNALAANTTGLTNTAYGYQALSSNTTGSGNTAGGDETLKNNTTGKENTAFGSSALFFNTVGNDLTAIGMAALGSNTTGTNNTAIGVRTLASNTIGSHNTAIGDYALYDDTTGNSNTATGEYSLFANTTGSANTADGAYSLFANMTGSDNSATGYQALRSNTTGSNNTANGRDALISNTTGFDNTASGYQSLFNNTTGINNTANGYQALYNNTSGSQNTAAGFNALHSNTTGFSNSANDYNALFNNTTGSQNTGSGLGALISNITGTYNTGLGYGADVGSGALTNATAIGANARVNQSDAVILGNNADVGIRTGSPQSELDIEGNGTITLKARSNDPATPATGTWRLYIYVNGNTKQLRIKSPAGVLTGMNLN